MQITNHTMAWRRFDGELADEIYIQCRGNGPDRDIARQTACIYRAMDERLRAMGGSVANVVYQTVFFRNIKTGFKAFQEACGKAFRNLPQPASMWIEQPPLDASAEVIVSAIAVIPHGSRVTDEELSGPAACRLLNYGDQKILYAGAMYGRPGNAFEQADSMFSTAAGVLARHGMNFRNVVRTWIYLRNMDRDYSDFNRARREFFGRQGVMILPASTGIAGAPAPDGADLALSFCAVQTTAGEPPAASAMTTPTLNEAPTYGSDFSRGLRVEEINKTVLYISGTASVDEEGRTAHVDDFGAQVERMLLNVEMLLQAQQASFRDVLSAVTYCKNPADATEFRRIAAARGLDDLPNAIVHAGVCRPDLLCEMEAIAALPASMRNPKS